MSARTVEFHEDCREAVEKFGGLHRDGLKRWMIASRESGLAARSITRITRINGIFAGLGEPYKLSFLKKATKGPPTYSAEHLKNLFTFKPKEKGEWRPHTLVLTIVDTRIRIEVRDMLLRVLGKGDKERLVLFLHSSGKRVDGTRDLANLD